MLNWLCRLYVKSINRKAAQYGIIGIKKAIAITENALRILPSSPSLHNQLAFLYLTAGAPDVSVIHLKKALILLGEKEGRFELWMNISIAYIHLGLPATAIQTFGKAEKLKDQVELEEYGKLLIFRAEARRDIVRRRLTDNINEQISLAMNEVKRGECIFRECDNKTASFWLEQIPRRKEEIESLIRG